MDDISIQGRNTQGVRLIRVESEQRLVGLARIESIEEEEAEEIKSRMLFPTGPLKLILVHSVPNRNNTGQISPSKRITSPAEGS